MNYRGAVLGQSVSATTAARWRASVMHTEQAAA